MKSRFDRIISVATLFALLVAIGLMLRRPAPVAQPDRPRADQQESAQQTQGAPQSQAGSGNFSGPSLGVQSPAVQLLAVQPVQNSPALQGAKAAPQVNSAAAQINSNEISAAVSQLLGASGAGLSGDSNVGNAMPNIKDQKVTYDGDTVHGQFLTEIGGKDVWITISGRMGQKDGYATFDPTEFKVGDVDVPVSLVNPALQRKLAEERDRLKIGEPAK